MPSTGYRPVVEPTTSAAARHLTAYHATATARAVAEWTRAAGAFWAGPVTDVVTGAAPVASLPARGLLWWATMADRREPTWHLPNEIVLSTPFAHLRDFSPAGTGTCTEPALVPTLVLPPQAGHSSHVVDFAPGQSQLATILAAGLTRLFALEWRPATSATAAVTITDYVDLIDRCIRRMGGRANLVGDCQGGWLAAIYAALYPHRVHTLTLAGAPIDFHAGESVIASSTRVLTSAFGLAPYRALVAIGGGVMPGRAVLANFIAIQPQAELARQLDLLASITDEVHVARYQVFEDWFTRTQDIPGAFYLWLVEHLFHRNELISGELVVGGRRADLGAITCPLFLLAGAADHITPAPQLFAAAGAVGTRQELVIRRTARGGHLGLFMGHDALDTDWPVLLAEVRTRS